MNHRRITLAIAAIVAAAALATIAFAVSQQVMAYRHHHHHHDNHISIKVDQQVNQENQCTAQSTDMQKWILTTPFVLMKEATTQQSTTKHKQSVERSKSLFFHVNTNLIGLRDRYLQVLDDGIPKYHADFRVRQRHVDLQYIHSVANADGIWRTPAVVAICIVYLR
jgi:hypothetical protein